MWLCWIRGTLAALVALVRRAPRETHALSVSGAILEEDNADDATQAAVVSAWRVFSPLPAKRTETTAADIALDLHEALLARTMHAKVARRVIDPELRAAIEETAAAAERRAAHLTRELERLIEEGGDAARRAARLALRFGARVRRELPAIALEGGWERWGIAGRCLEDEASDRALTAVERRLRDLGYSDFGFGAPGPSFVASPSASWRKISS